MILAIGAHPDDIEHGCLGTLARLKEDVRVLVLSGKGTERENECRSSFAVAGISAENVDVWGWEDGYFHCNPVTVGQVRQRILAQNTTTLFTQTAWDTHQDHRTVFDIVLAASRRLPITLIGYHAISSTPEFPVNLISDITCGIDLKIQALKEHKSQIGKPYFNEDIFRSWHYAKQGTTVGMQYVELFHIFHAYWRDLPQ